MTESDRQLNCVIEHLRRERDNSECPVKRAMLGHEMRSLRNHDLPAEVIAGMYEEIKESG